jgi:hypothetical protein
VSLEKRKQIDPLDQAIEAALSPGNFIPYNAAWSFVDDLQDVANDIGRLIKKDPKRAANLYGTFIATCHEKADEVAGVPKHVDPPFLECAKARWPRKSDS